MLWNSLAGNSEQYIYVDNEPTVNEKNTSYAENELSEKAESKNKEIIAKNDTADEYTSRVKENMTLNKISESTVSSFILKHIHILSVIWLAGVILFMIYGGIAYASVRKKVSEAILYKGNIYLCDNIDSPFVFGMLIPHIYLPSSIELGDMSNVIAHESVHIKYKHYLWKMLAFILLAVYWINPLVWVTYILFARDVELACDERVISDMKPNEKKAYVTSLLSCSTNKKLVFSYFLHFKEIGVKERVCAVKKYKKHSIVTRILGVLICFVAAFSLLTMPIMQNDVISDTADVVYAGFSPDVFNSERNQKNTDIYEEISINKELNTNQEPNTDKEINTNKELNTNKKHEADNKSNINSGVTAAATKENGTKAYEFDGCTIEPRWYVYDGLMLYFAYDVIDWDTKAPDINVSVSVPNAYITDMCIKETKDTVIMETIVILPNYYSSLNIFMSAKDDASSEKYCIPVNMSEGKTVVSKATDIDVYLSTAKESINIRHIDITNGAISFTVVKADGEELENGDGFIINAKYKDGREELVSDMLEPLIINDDEYTYLVFPVSLITPENIDEIIISTSDLLSKKSLSLD